MFKIPLGFEQKSRRGPRAREKRSARTPFAILTLAMSGCSKCIEPDFLMYLKRSRRESNAEPAD